MSAATITPASLDVLGVTEQVWESFLGSEEPLLPAAPYPDDLQSWSATVTISGGWEGRVCIELPEAAAHAVARAMLMIDDVADEDVADAVGELVNMVGGNIKSLLPGPSTLSLPVVATGRVATSSEFHPLCRADLQWAGHPVSVAVHHHQSRS